MSEELLIQYCSPTLAGLKTGSLFTCEPGKNNDICQMLTFWNRQLRSKGLRCISLGKAGKNRMLIYVYRPEQLARDLGDPAAVELLQRYGYLTDRAGTYMRRLIERLRQEDAFPHEIGLFLGYPPEDVKGFIDNKAGGCKYVGTWKVYGDVEKAVRTFRRFRRCTEIYTSAWAKGTPLSQLAVRIA